MHLATKCMSSSISFVMSELKWCHMTVCPLHFMPGFTVLNFTASKIPISLHIISLPSGLQLIGSVMWRCNTQEIHHVTKGLKFTGASG